MSQMDAGFPQAPRTEPQPQQQQQQQAAIEANWGSDSAIPPPSMPRRPSVRGTTRSALLPRLVGPGGYYNIGNALGLVSGVALSVVAAGGAQGPTLQTGVQAVYDYLAGSASALSISAAMLIFFWSGEVYLRAWAGGFPPDARLNRRGDLLSAFGALMLGLGLFLLGQPLLAATAGLLHAAGKFGSALQDHSVAPARRFWPDPFRTAVLISRVPALVILLIELAAALSAPGGPAPLAVAAPALLITCYLLWAKADLLLFRS